MKRLFLATSLAGASLFAAATAHADQWTDEANRQATMSRMAAQDSANDRAQADRSFQAGLANQRSSSGGGGSYGGSGGSGTAIDGIVNAHRTEPLPQGPQSVVARRTLIVQIKESPAQVVARLEKEAAAGNTQSAFDLARVLWTGYGGVARNDAAARRWFGVAGNGGNRDAQAQYGYMLYNGVGGPVDKTGGLAHLAKAAAAGDPYAAGLHAFYTMDYRSDRPQPDKVANLVKAADAGFLFAQVALGTIVYDLGVGTKQDNTKAAYYSRLAADRGHPLAQVQIGRMLISGRAGKKDPVAGAAYIRKAAEAGHPEAMRLIGQLLITGEGISKDEAAGWRWMRKAADAGDANAQGLVGASLLLGQGQTANPAGALPYLRKGAKAGDPQAQFYWGYLQVTGEFGVPVNKQEAARLLRAAAAQRFQPAIVALQDPEMQAELKGF